MGESKETKEQESEDQVNVKAIIAVVVIAILLLAIPSGYFILMKDSEEEEDDDDDDDDDDIAILTITGKSGEEALTLSGLEELDIQSGTTSYENRFGNIRGSGPYSGVLLKDLAEQVGGMTENDVMTVTATDGYSQNISYYQVYPEGDYVNIQGNIILAYEFNGTKIPDWSDGPMIAVLAPDGLFSNEDMNATVPEHEAFAKVGSAGSLWVRNVDEITISHVGEI